MLVGNKKKQIPSLAYSSIEMLSHFMSIRDWSEKFKALLRIRYITKSPHYEMRFNFSFNVLRPFLKEIGSPQTAARQAVLFREVFRHQRRAGLQSQ
jgi:hypothetical protein